MCLTLLGGGGSRPSQTILTFGKIFFLGRPLRRHCLIQIVVVVVYLHLDQQPFLRNRIILVVLELCDECVQLLEQFLQCT